ncbi:ABC transporter permease [Parenemella sanctibonifatiensis]|uniref:ABC transporter permease n=1 Tax=Parenemella sanctibonifatiensis TaxID=2016505 RepID=A0A255E9Q3_9ACTN|nr:ABC transporter permease [Parenemella sanctibonifatiensis]OYN88289.1 ABC transporter permease [Parenemella sanctibonifatiensis]
MSVDLDLSPAPAAAPRGALIRQHAATEAMLLLRNGEQLLLALVIPVAALLLGQYWGPLIGLSLAELAPTVLALAVWSTAFTSLAIATGFERRYAVLERLAATPLRRGGIIVGKALGFTVVALGQLVLLAVIALVLGWRPHPHPAQIPIALLVLVLAALAYAGAALCLAGTLRAEITLALANLIYLAALPTLVMDAAWLSVLPTTALAQALRGLALGQLTWLPLIVTAVWAAAMGLLARKVFRWTS